MLAVLAMINLFDKVNGIWPSKCLSFFAVSAFYIPIALVRRFIDLFDPESRNGRIAYPIDDAQIRLYHPAGIAKFQLRNLQVPVDENILFRDPNLVSTEIAVWQNNRPAAEAINGHAFALAAVRLIALGYRFHTLDLEEGKYADSELVKALKAGAQPCTHVWCSGRGIGD